MFFMVGAQHNSAGHGQKSRADSSSVAQSSTRAVKNDMGCDTDQAGLTRPIDETFNIPKGPVVCPGLRHEPRQTPDARACSVGRAVIKECGAAAAAGVRSEDFRI